MLYAFLWVIPRRLNFICRRFGTLCLFHLHRQVGELYTHLPAYEDAFFRVIPRHLKFICRRFGTLSLFHLHRQVGELYTHLPAYEDAFFWVIPGGWSLYADVSEQSVCSIFICRYVCIEWILPTPTCLWRCFLPGNFPASDVYMPTFRNTLSVPFS